MAAKGKSTASDDAGGPGRRPRALRPFWSGTLSFGLVSVPVELYAGHRAGGLPLRLLAPDGTPVKRRYFCPAHRREQPVDGDDIVRGYVVKAGEYVVVEDRELEELAPRKSRDIDLTRFVPAADIPASHFQRAYFLTPAGDTTKAYRLLATVMAERELAGLATFVMRGREYPVAIFADNGLLRAETLRFADELRDPETVGLPAPAAPAGSRVKRMRSLVADHHLEAVPQRLLVDEAAEALRRLAERKDREDRDVVRTRRGGGRADAASGGGAEVVDLLEVIRGRLRGDGDPGKLTKDELYRKAREHDIPGRSRMTKEELARALAQAG